MILRGPELTIFKVKFYELILMNCNKNFSEDKMIIFW